MYRLTLATVATAALFAVPAFAQTTTQNTSPNMSANTASTTTQKPSMSTPQARQKIMTDLKNDGFTNIQVVPDSFLVHATNKRNEAVVMIINPDSVFETTAMPPAAAGNTSAQHAAPSSGTAAAAK